MRILLVRIGAFGDVIITTPIIRYLKQKKNEVYVVTSERGEQILRYNPNIDKLIIHKKDSVQFSELDDKWKKLSEEYKCDKIIDLSSSIETKLALHPIQPEYNWSKRERIELCDKNYYEYTSKLALGKILEPNQLRPEIFFSEKEKEDHARFKANLFGKKTILVGLSGSGLNKAYPYLQYVMSAILEGNKDVVFITVGDESCKILEAGLIHERVIHRSGVWNFRESMIACKSANMVIAPDTGLLHASGCFDTPKIGLLGHTSVENITKHFKNDMSLQSTTSCSPCFRLIYNLKEQCPIDVVNGGAFCMSIGIDPNLIIKRILKVVGIQK